MRMHHRKLRVDSFWVFGVTPLEPICTQAQEGEAQGLQMHTLLVVKLRTGALSVRNSTDIQQERYRGDILAGLVSEHVEVSL